MFFSDMERKTLAITPPSFFFHFGGASFGSSKAFHCLLLLSCLLLSSVNTLHNLAEYGYNTGSAAKEFQGFINGEDSESVTIQKTDQNVCPNSELFCFLLALGSKNRYDPVVPFFGLPCPKELRSCSVLIRKNLSGVVWLSPKHVHFIEFQSFTEFFHIGDTCYEPMSKELYTKKITRELSITVSGKQCGRNCFMVNHQCEGFSLEPRYSIKFLYFYQTELSWAYGVVVFAVPMKTTTPVLMLNLCKKPVFWVRTKKFSIAVLIAVALLILIFCFNDHFIEEKNKGNNRNHMELREVEKPSMTTISPTMNYVLRSISKESLQVFDEVPKSIKRVASTVSSSHEELSEDVNLTVKTAIDKKRRRNRKKNKGGINRLTPECTNVSSSHIGNSSPRSPISPEPHTTTQATTKPVNPPKPVLSYSTTFSVSGVQSKIIQQSSVAPNVRDPSAKSRSEVKEEKAKEYMYYDIWGYHLTGLHLMDMFKEVREGKSSSFDGEECESFFVKGPHNLFADSHTRFVSFCNQWD